jgi:hypothetical protein
MEVVLPRHRRAPASALLPALALALLAPRATGAEVRPDSLTRSANPAYGRVRENAVVDTIPTVEITDTFDRSVRRVHSSSQHALTAAEIRERPISRPGELLEAIPGVLISQHSGEGKANQYYLRGFNLDHGTDMATFVAGIPVNLPSHAHGQGYSDLNFLIPELVTGVEYKKGTYFAEEGDFGTAGAAHIAYANRLDAPIAQLSADDYGYRRALVAGSSTLARGDLLYAFEGFHNDGPWGHPDDYRKLNGILRWGRAGSSQGYRITAMGYDGRWNSTDQIADRALSEGLIPRFGSLDPTDGGFSHRYSLSGDWQRFTPRSLSEARAYVVDYGLNLFSNFTYFLEDSVHGDQFEQADRRVVSGLLASHTWKVQWAGREIENVAGLQTRRDDIGSVGLYHTEARMRLATIRQDRVTQTSASPYAQSTIPWQPWLRSTLGLRGDAYWFQVRSDNPLNSGNEHSAIFSPKVGLSLGPWWRTAYFLDFGTGFHSNDARGSTIRVDPKSLEPVSRVKPLVRATGAECGAISNTIPRVESALTLWLLDLESELVFTGDAGTTEPSRPSRRLGVEWTETANLGSRLLLDADLAYSHARFTSFDPVGDRIPGAVEGVISAGLTAPEYGRWFGSLRLRYFGPRPLIEDNSVRSRPSTIFNADLGYALGRWGRLALEGFNLLDARVSDIDYYYVSRLRGEPTEGVNDVHTHPEAPRTIRLRLTASWPRSGADESLPPQTGHPKSDSGAR